jgi:hypothetical protein
MCSQHSHQSQPSITAHNNISDHMQFSRHYAMYQMTYAISSEQERELTLAVSSHSVLVLQRMAFVSSTAGED